jgi:hypothetical protein
MNSKTTPFWILSLSIALLGGCASLPPVDSPPPAETRFTSAETPLKWAQRANACSDAARRANRAARRTCDLSSFTSARESCECERESDGERRWQCTAEAAFTCADHSSAQGLATR